MHSEWAGDLDGLERGKTCMHNIGGALQYYYYCCGIDITALPGRTKELHQPRQQTRTGTKRLPKRVRACVRVGTFFLSPSLAGLLQTTPGERRKESSRMCWPHLSNSPLIGLREVDGEDHRHAIRLENKTHARHHGQPQHRV